MHSDQMVPFNHDKSKAADVNQQTMQHFAHPRSGIIVAVQYGLVAFKAEELQVHNPCDGGSQLPIWCQIVT